MSNHRSTLWLGLAVPVATLLAPSVKAQCLDWKDSFEFSPPGVSFSSYYLYSEVKTIAVWDDGTGPALYLGGRFTTAGGAPAASLAKWDGVAWSDLPGGLDPTFLPFAMTIFDDGSGPALIVGGQANGSGNQVYRFDGSSWTPLGHTSSDGVHSLAVFDDGSGPALYAGGGGEYPNNVARWTGSSWTSVGGGVSGTFDSSIYLQVNGLTVFDDGSGQALYAGGNFVQAGGNAVRCIAKWDGTSWSGLAGGTPGSDSDVVRSLAVFDDGGGARLYAGGTFGYLGGVVVLNAAKWDGTAWSILGSGPGGDVMGLAVSDQGGVDALYAIGRFPGAVGHPDGSSLTRWNGTAWTPLGGRLRKLSYNAYDPGWPLCVTSFDDGSGPAVYSAGDYFCEDHLTALHAIGKWSGTAWSPLGPPSDRGFDGQVLDLAALDLGGGPALYAAGAFHDAGGAPCQGIARWTGAGWSPLRDGVLGEVDEVVSIGNSIYAGGSFASDFVADGVARWDGSQWSSLPGGGGLNGYVSALLARVEGGGTMLYAGGNFVQGGGIWPRRLARWNGSNWSPLGTGVDATVYALASYDDGTGSAVIAGGAFLEAGGLSANHIAKWDGTNWSLLGTGLNGSVHALLTFDDGTGEALYVGGDFTTAGGATANRIARWKGSSWSTLGSGFDGTVYDLAVHDDGNGPALFASGSFGLSGSVGVQKVARWNGVSWRSAGSGVGGTVRALASFDDGTSGGADLWVGGDFASTATVPASRVGAWRGCSEPVSGMCYGDGTVAPCPCGNQGVFRHGCENSAHTGGARLYATGNTVPDTLVLHAVGEMPSALTIFLQGNALIYETAAFGDGLRCVGGALKRLYVHNAVAGTAVAPQGGDLSITARSAAAGDPIPAGGTRYYQTYYRDPNVNYCPAPQGNTFNSTNGLRVVW